MPVRKITVSLVYRVPDTETNNCLSTAVLQPLGPSGPGEMGKPVVIPQEKQAEMREKFKINQFNLMASEMISVNRTLPDVRMDA